MKFVYSNWSTILLLTFTSCDCHVAIQGIVIDKESGKPIQNAKVNMTDRDIEELTDNGIFDIGEHSGFCYDPKVEVSMNGYKPFRIQIIHRSEYTSYNIESEGISVDYDEPFYPDPSNKNTFMTGTWINKFSEDFKVSGDTIILYLEEDNLEKEIQRIKEHLRKTLGNSSYTL